MIVLIAIQSCGQQSEEQYIPEDLAALKDYAAQKENIRSVLVSQHDKTIANWYFKSFDRDSLEHIRSGTKSVMSLLIGIAIDRGIIGSVEDQITTYLDDVASDKQDMTIRHLLTMTSGVPWEEGVGYNDWNRMIDSGNPYRYWMDRPRKHEVGEKWAYSSGDTHILSVILTRASGISTLDFAEQYLFGPLGIRRVLWQKFPDGYYAGASRLALKPKDMIKIGQLCENLGIYDGKRVVSESYIRQSTGIQFEFMEKGNVREGYGFCWWAVELDDKRAYMALGYGGQAIAVIPSQQLVVAVTHKWKLGGHQAAAQQKSAQDVAVAAWAWARQGPLPIH
ncbi:MAG: serine hydrolase [Cytophagales bacterium]|nr:serine hydrolase [Cytophagales bacterium]